MRFWFLALAGLVALCAQAGGKKAPDASASGDTSLDKVWIYRPDGARSCSPKSGQSLESVQQELVENKVRVLDARKGGDGKMHAQFCGADTGGQNTFLIPKAELAIAEALGFKEKK